MKELILIGGGGHCKACIDVIESERRYIIRGILDTADKRGEKILGYETIGTDDDISTYVKAGCHFLITIGQIRTHKIRENIYLALKQQHAQLATIISARAYVSKHAVIGEGSIIMHDAFINADAKVMDNCIINTKAIIEHDSTVEAHSHISTGAVINGGVTVAAGTFFGSNAVSKQGITTLPADFIKAGQCFTGHDNQRGKVAFLTTLFPVPDDYIHDYMRSLSNQSWKAFDLILLNDGFGDFQRFKEQYKNLNIIELPSANNIAKNREVLIKFALSNGYTNAVFGDIDDYFDQDRIATSVSLLQEHDIVVNDLTSFAKSNVLETKVLSNRLVDRERISLDFILDKNIFGLSNTAIKLTGLDCSKICFDPDLIAVDWYLFSYLLLNQRTAIFTNKAITYYRQHDANTVGIGAISVESIQKALLVKGVHYKNMVKLSNIFNTRLENVVRLGDAIQNAEKLGALLQKNEHEIDFPLWWEIIE